MTLKHDNLCELEVKTGPDDIDFSDYEIEICFSNSPPWQTLATAETYDWTTGIAGNFELRAKAKVGDCTLYSMPTFATVQFPTREQILLDAGVTNAMNAEWQETLFDSTSISNREHGFMIYLDTNQDTYSVAGYAEGAWCVPGARASVWLNFYQDAVCQANAVGNNYLVASFHTHPPETYAPTNTSRKTGPSDTDIDVADDKQVPGFVYDYAAARIYAGHLESDPTRVHQYGPERKEVQ